MTAAVASFAFSAQENNMMDSDSNTINSQHMQPTSSAVNLQMMSNQQTPYYLRPGYRFKTNLQPNAIDMMSDGPGRRLRKNVANVRRHIDYISNVLNHFENRLWQYGSRNGLAVQPDILYQNSAVLPARTVDKTIDCVLNKFVRAAMNKVKCPIYSICWTPEGKRLITGASTGEFTLWNGTAFNFETILQAHDTAIRALKWSHSDQWLVSTDHDGFIKYWQPNMNNVHMYQAHKDEPIRSVSFAPTDIKLVTGSDDGTARIWDFARCSEERVLRGHGSDVRSVDWHPHKGLICTGSRDSQQPVKLWDPRTGQCLSTLHDHKNSVMSVQWNKNGNWLLTGSRDHLIKLYDIRMMREMHTFRGHKKEVTALAWHPVHESLFVSGGGEGSLAYWLVNNEKELGFLEHAHDQAIWTLEWHPLGHILASGSNDNNTKFWARNRPGDTQEDIFGLASLSTNVSHAISKDTRMDVISETNFRPTIPGMGLDEDVFQGMQNRELRMTVGGPPTGGPLLFPEDPNARQLSANIGAKRTLIKQPPPKKAQRQFERMWNVAKPGGGGDDYDDDLLDDGTFRKSKTSLLGPPPHSMLSSKRKENDLSANADIDGRTGTQGTTGSTLCRDNMAASVGSLPLPVHPPPSNANIMQQWTSSASQGANVQQMAHQNVSQAGIPSIPLPSVPVPPVGAQLIWPPPLPATATSGATSVQNRDIDYRMAATSLPIPTPVSIQNSPNPPGDIDLRNQRPSSSSQSWRPLATDNQPLNSDESLIVQSAGGDMRIHDPRMRRLVIPHDAAVMRNGVEDISATVQNPHMRDPRRRPQSGANTQNQEGDYDARSQTWVPSVGQQSRGGNRRGSLRSDYNNTDLDDRVQQQSQQYSFQQRMGGGPIRSGRVSSGSRGRSRVRSRRGAF